MRAFADIVALVKCPCTPRDGENVCNLLFRLVEKLLFLDNVGEFLKSNPPEYFQEPEGKYRRIDYYGNAKHLYVYLDGIIASGNMSSGQKCVVHLFSGIIAREQNYRTVIEKLYESKAIQSYTSCYDHACNSVSANKSLNDKVCAPPYRFRGRLYHKDVELPLIYKDMKQRCLLACDDFSIVLKQEKNDVHVHEFKKICLHADKNGRCSIKKNGLCPQ